jgi:transposase-like protein
MLKSFSLPVLRLGAQPFDDGLIHPPQAEDKHCAGSCSEHQSRAAQVSFGWQSVPHVQPAQNHYHKADRDGGQCCKQCSADLIGLACMRPKRPALFKGRHFEAEIIVLCVRWYLRFSLSFRNLEEMMVERHLSVDHVTIWRWVQRYAPELHRRCRPELRKTNGSWRCDEMYVRVAGKWTYLYRAVDSTGATIDFLLSAKRDAAAAKRFFQEALRSPGHPRPRVINVDRNPAYPGVIDELKQTGELGRRCRCRPVRYLNNIVEQDHRFIRRRVRASQGFRAFHSAWRTLQGIETVNMIRRGQVKWLPKNDIAGQAAFVDRLLGARSGVIVGPTASHHALSFRFATLRESDAGKRQAYDDRRGDATETANGGRYAHPGRPEGRLIKFRRVSIDAGGDPAHEKRQEDSEQHNTRRFAGAGHEERGDTASDHVKDDRPFPVQLFVEESRRIETRNLCHGDKRE